MIAREVLIVDDDPQFRESVRYMFPKKEYNFVEAGSVEEAVKVLDNNPNIQIVLLDLSLENESGEELLKKIGPLLSRYRVIILTAHEEKLVAEKAERYEVVFNYLPKVSKSFRESIRFSIDQAAKDIEKVYLENKNYALIKIHSMINNGIQEMAGTGENMQALREVLNVICKSVNSIIGSYTCHVRLFDLSRGDYVLAGYAGRSEEITEILNRPRKKGESFSGMIAETKRAETFGNVQKNRNFIAYKKQIYQGNPLLKQPAQDYLDTIQSAYIAPITTRMFADETDAVFNVSSDHLDFFSEEKRKIVDEFVAQATIAITKAWQANRTEESHRDYQGINKVLENISKELKGENVSSEIYATAIEGISRIINPETITIFLFNPGTGQLDNVAESNRNVINFHSNYSNPIDGLTGWVFKNGKPLRIPDLQGGDRRKLRDIKSYSKAFDDRYVSAIPSRRLEHYLGVPMFIGDKPVGVIQLLNKKSYYYGNASKDEKTWLLDRGFSADSENVLGIAASHIAVAIRSAELFEERNQKISQLNTLQGVGRYTSTEMPLDELLERIIEETALDLKAQVCLLFLLDESGTRVMLKQRYGIPANFLDGAFYELNEGVTGGVAKTGRPVLMGPASKMPVGKISEDVINFLKKQDKEARFESLMIVPIRAKGKILGVIQAINKENDDEQYDQDDLEFFEAFGDYVGIAIENAQLYELTNQKLIDAEKNAALSFMLRAVVHEINNTEAIIPLNVQMIRARLASGNYDIEEMIDVIEDSAGQAVAFANSIQAFSASRIGNRERQDINEILEKALNQIDIVIKNNKQFAGLLITQHLSSKPLLRSVYETPLIQVFQNIILNACQAMTKSKKKNLTITSYEDKVNGLVIIEFSDTGTGIKNEIIDRIFDPGFTTKQGSGTGIGLWLAETHLKSINAEIKIESDLAKGTKVIIQIPVDTTVSEED